MLNIQRRSLLVFLFFSIASRLARLYSNVISITRKFLLVAFDPAQ